MKPKHSVNSTEIPPLLSGITTTDKYLAVLIEGANNTELSGLPICCKYAAELPMFMDLFYNPFQKYKPTKNR